MSTPDYTNDLSGMLSNHAFQIKDPATLSVCEKDESCLQTGLRSIAYSGLQSPLSGVVQLVDYCADTNYLPRVQFISAPKEANPDTAAWYAQQIGGAAGFAFDYLAVQRLTGGRSTPPATLPFWRRSAESCLGGATFDGLFRPVLPREGDFIDARFKHAGIGALTMLSQSVADVPLAWMEKRGILGTNTLDSMLAKPVLASLSSVPVGLVNVNLTSLSQGKGWANQTQMWDAACGFALAGGTMRLMHGLPEFRNPKSPVSNSIEWKLNSDGTWSGKSSDGVHTDEIMGTIKATKGPDGKITIEFPQHDRVGYRSIGSIEQDARFAEIQAFHRLNGLEPKVTPGSAFDSAGYKTVDAHRTPTSTSLADTQAAFWKLNEDMTWSGVLKDGTLVDELPGGLRAYRKPDKTFITEYPNGDSVTILPDKTRIEDYPANRSEEQYYRPDLSFHHAGFADSLTGRLETKPFQIITKPDGERIELHPFHKKITRRLDGSVTEEQSGLSKTTSADGVIKLENAYSDESITYSPDGRVVVSTLGGPTEEYFGSIMTRLEPGGGKSVSFRTSTPPQKDLLSYPNFPSPNYYDEHFIIHGDKKTYLDSSGDMRQWQGQDKSEILRWGITAKFNPETGWKFDFPSQGV